MVYTAKPIALPRPFDTTHACTETPQLYPQTAHHRQDSSSMPPISHCTFERGFMEGPPDDPAFSAPLYDGQHHLHQSATPPYAMPPQNAGRDGTYSPVMGDNSYPQQPYPGASSSMVPQSTTAASAPRPIDPALATAGGRDPPVLRPMPAGGVMSQLGMKSPYSQRPLMPRDSMMPNTDAPTHLFRCPSCTRSYKKTKYLKRHQLQHTGDRPYRCSLCQHTFTRSDVLKRHFTRCAVKRGNPTGASHLPHPQARTKKNAAA